MGQNAEQIKRMTVDGSVRQRHSGAQSRVELRECHDVKDVALCPAQDIRFTALSTMACRLRASSAGGCRGDNNNISRSSSSSNNKLEEQLYNH